MEPVLDLAEAFRAHEGRVYTYFRRMGADRETARDLSQETFLRAFRGARRFRGESSVGTWLLGIARNVFRAWLRKRRQPADDPWVADDPETSLEHEPIDVQRVLAKIAPEFREVLVLRFALDLSGEEVARLLGISHEAVRQRVARGKAAFQAVWEA